MKKKLIGGSILFLMIGCLTWLTWNAEHPYLRSVVVQTAVVYSQEENIRQQTQDPYLYKEYYKRPFDFNSYERGGYYRFDPKTIFTSLQNGEMNFFEPLSHDPNTVEKITDVSISWTQADYLEIFSALSTLVWDDSMDPMVWKIYDIDFLAECIDESCIFDQADIVYFKISANSYTTRIMRLQPSLGLARWGDETSYPLVRQWEGVELTTARITAEDALKIAEENGGREIRLKAADKCILAVSSPALSSSGSNNKNWHVRYIFQDPPIYEFFIDFDTGKYEFNEMYGLP